MFAIDFCDKNFQKKSTKSTDIISKKTTFVNFMQEKHCNYLHKKKSQKVTFFVIFLTFVDILGKDQKM